MISIQSRKEPALRDRAAAIAHARSTWLAKRGDSGSTIPGCTPRTSLQKALTSAAVRLDHARAAVSGDEAAVVALQRSSTAR